MLRLVSTAQSHKRLDRTDKLQWYLSRCWANGHAWSQSSPYVRLSGASPPRALLVSKTTPALLLADSLLASEVRFSFSQASIANTLSEAGFSPLIQVFLSRFYAREKLGTRVAVWLAMAPLG
jgi:hypothetical protein